MTGDTQLDTDAFALQRVLASETTERDWFEPGFLRRHPLRIVQQTVRLFLDRHGPLVGVEREGDRWRATYARGHEPVIARFGSDGRIAGLGIGPVAETAEIELPYREWPRSVVKRRLASGMVVPCLAPPAFAAALWTADGTVGWALVAALGAFACGGIWLSAPWHVFSRRLREPLVGGSMLAGAASAVRLPGLAAGGVTWWPVIGLGAVLLALAARLRESRGGPAPLSAVELAFPLGPGDYVVAQGGPAPLNQHATNVAQRAALDILAVGRLGSHCAPPAVYPGRLERYAVFDRPVVAPCAGIVVEASDDVPDLEPPLRTPDRPPGNCVAIEADGAIVLLAHLRSGTVLVREGDRVIAGQSLGRVGNSGNTTEPHLHIHAERDGVGVPIVFREAKRRPLRRNDLVRVRA
jgi:Peptidase family M23